MKKTVSFILLLSVSSLGFAQISYQSSSKKQVTLSLNLDHAKVEVSPMLYGLMTEEINHSYDGGLYAELIQNRIFKDKKDTAVHWSLVKDNINSGGFSLDTTNPINTALTTCLRLDVGKEGGEVGFTNDGYWGIPVKPNTIYRASFYVKSANKEVSNLNVRIESRDGKTVYAKGTVLLKSSDWKKYTLKLSTSNQVLPIKDARFVITTSVAGSYWFNLVSLFPPTYNNRPNGNRIDLMELQMAMSPKFLRFPGGDYLEGKRLEDRFAFKNTIHDISLRPGKNSRWYYRSSDGMGLLEFLEWCEDLKMEPLLAVYAGYSVAKGYLATGAELTPFVKEALEEIEYVIGDVNTPYGKQRAADGHPAPFKLQYVEVGNEDFFDKSGSYDERFAPFYDAIRTTYPKLKIIATTKVKSRKADMIDDHFYRTPEVFRGMSHEYDKYSRDSTPIFVGEWASQDGKPTTNMNAALGDAAWMIGLERNADIVKMQCYAPLFTNINKGASQWGWNLIGYDALNSFGSPSYYAQVMFGNHVGNKVVPVIEENIPTEWFRPAKVPNKPQADSINIPTFFSDATKDSKNNLLYLKLVNSSGTKQPVKINLQGTARIQTKATIVTLSADSLKATNSITNPKNIVPVNHTIDRVGKEFEYEVAPFSVNVLTIKLK